MTSIVRYIPTPTPSPVAAPSELVTSALDILRLASNLKTRPRAFQKLTVRLDAGHFRCPPGEIHAIGGHFFVIAHRVHTA